MSNKTFQLRVYGHPVEQKAPSLDVLNIPWNHQTLAQVQRKFSPNPEVYIKLDGVEIPKGDWKKTHVRTNSIVEIMPSVGFWAAITGAIGSISWSTVFVNLALGFAFSFLGGMLFGSNPKQSEDKGDSSNYSWTPQTVSKEGGAIPRAYGRTMHTGNIIAKWTDAFHGSKADYTAAGLTDLWNRLFGLGATEPVNGRSVELLYMIVDFGSGPTQGNVAGGLFLNDQPVGNYPDVTVQERKGTDDQTCMTGFEKTRIEYRPGTAVTNTDGAITFTTPNNFFDDVEFTLEFTRGLWHYDDSGERGTHSVGVKVEISEKSLNTWTVLLNQSLSGDIMSPVYRAYAASTLGFTCTYGKQYDLRITKTTADKGQDRYGDELAFRAVREVVNTAFTYPGHALIGITAAASSLLSGSIEVKCIRDNRIVNTYNGTSWTLQHSYNYAWAVLDALTQPVITGNGSTVAYAVDHYEGFDPARIDLAFFYEWATFCGEQVSDGSGGSENRFNCNFTIDTATDVWSVANELANVARCHVYWQGNVLSGWLDDAVDDPGTDDLVTWDCIMARSWRNSWTAESEMAGNVETFYRDALQGYERKSFPWSNENAGLYTRTISIEASGTTKRSQAIRIANFALERNRLIRNVNSYQKHKDAMRNKLGDVVRVQALTPDWGQNYKVSSVDSDMQTLTMDRRVDALPNDLLYIRTYDATSGVENVTVTPYTIATADDKVITVLETLDPVPVGGEIAATGGGDSGSDEMVLRRIIKITESQNNYYQIDVETYDPALYDADGDVSHPSYNSNYVWPSPANRLIKPANWDNVSDMIDRMIPPAPDIEIPWLSNVDWVADSGGTITWSARDAAKPILFRYRGVSYSITADNSDKEFIYWNPSYTTLFLGTDDVNVAIASGNWVVCINKGGTAYPASPSQLIHAGLILAGTIRAESYAQLRQTMPWMGEDSCDASYPYTFDFKIPSEWEADVSYRLSFKIKPFRAYSTGAASGGGSTSGNGGGTTVTSGTSGGTSASGGGQTSSSGGGQTTSAYNASAGSTQLTEAGGAYDYTSYEDGTGSHRHSWTEAPNGHSHGISSWSHDHTVSDHTHTVADHTHGLGDHTHSVTLSNHTHSTPAHTHNLTFALYEETNSPTIHFHVDNGSGYGAASANYTSDQTDIDITSQVSGAGWKAVRFDVSARCRIVAILEAKIDITA